METIKTTIRLNNVDEIDELLNKHPEIKVTLSEKAAMQVARHLNADMARALNAALESVFGQEGPWHVGNKWLHVTGYPGGAKLELGEEARRFLYSQIQQAVKNAVQDQLVYSLIKAKKEACMELLEKVDVHDIISSAKAEILTQIKERIDKELTAGVLTTAKKE